MGVGKPCHLTRSQQESQSSHMDSIRTSVTRCACVWLKFVVAPQHAAQGSTLEISKSHHVPGATFIWPRSDFFCYPQVLVAQKVTTGVYKGVTTSELDDLAAETAASMTATHPDYATVCLKKPSCTSQSLYCWGAACLKAVAWWLLTSGCCVAIQLAARIAVSNLHKNTLKSFSET